MYGGWTWPGNNAGTYFGIKVSDGLVGSASFGSTEGYIIFGSGWVKVT